MTPEQPAGQYLNLNEAVAQLLDQPGPLPIVTAGDPVLRIPARPYDGELSDSTLATLIQAMRETMYAAPGVGLAAPQIGLPVQIAVLADSAAVDPAIAEERQRFPLSFRTIINPQYRAIDTEQATFFEGCLSVPGYQAMVQRPAQISLTCLDEHGRHTVADYSGWSARIVQHETDHLGGILYLDKAFTRSLCSNDQLLTHWSGVSVPTVRSILDF